MTDRDYDVSAMRYLAAVEAEDFAAAAEMWLQAERDPQLAAMLHELHAELAAAYDDRVESPVVATIERLLPSAIVERAAAKSMTVAEVAELLRRHPPSGLTLDDLRTTDTLLASTDPLPATLGLPETVEWGRKFGAASEACWKAFREAALLLRMQRESHTDNWQMAARPAKRTGARS